MNANRGDFVTATVDLPEPYPTRQGILDGNILHGESGEDYILVEVHAIVESYDLFESTRTFVQQWRKENL